MVGAGSSASGNSPGRAGDNIAMEFGAVLNIVNTIAVIVIFHRKRGRQNSSKALRTLSSLMGR